MGRRLGLVVGVNRYKDNTFQPLQFAENDARAFAQWLVNEQGGKWAPADVQHVYGINATRDLIESLVLQLCLSVAQPDDLVLIYIASHAFLDERSGDGYLALADTSYGNPGTGLHLLSFAQQVMTKSRAAHIVFMFDSFQTGQAWSTRQSSPYDMQPLLGPVILAGLQQQQDRILLTSCRGNAFSAEVGERSLGLLMYRMIVGLSGPATDPITGNVTLQTLHMYLASTLGMQQRPQVFGQTSTRIVLVGDSTRQQAVQTMRSTDASPAYTASVTQIPQGAVVQQGSYNGTATAQLTPYSQRQQRTTSGHLRSAEIEQHRQQQSAFLLNQASQQFQAQHMEEALQVTEQALQITQGESSGLILKGQILGTMGRFPEALATVEQLRQQEPDNALAWSMGAVLLTNMGRHQDALAAIERSLELDASNPESYAIKTNIMSSIAIAQNSDKTLPKNELIASEKRRGGPLSFFMGLGLQFVGLLLGITGGLLPILRPTLPMVLSFLLESLGLAILCVNAARGSYRNGFLRVFVTLFFSLIPVAILSISLGYRPIYRKIIFEMQAHTTFLLPLLFLGLWLAAAAIVPVILAIIGFISGMVTGVRRRK
ncbi:MAG: hypothetical protein NVS2B2_23310 [Ktedonobacteraceae bacterium]